MRKDFHKVVTERPRRKYIVKNRRNATKVFADPYDMAPGGKEGIRRPYRKNRFEFSDHIQPLRRYIEKQVGRKWDDVYSEICKAFPAGGILQDHVRSHVWDFIETVTSVGENGEILTHGRYKYAGTPRKIGADEVYVHPITRIICRSNLTRQSRKQRRKELEAKRRETQVKISEKKVCVKVDGLWYMVELAKIPETFTVVEKIEPKKPYFTPMGYEKVEGGWKVWKKEYTVVRDVLLNESVCWQWGRHKQYELYGDHDVYAVSKRQLSKKEIKQYVLKKQK